MFGAKLYFWEPEDPATSSGIVKMLLDYALSRSSIGHSALALTIPHTPENKALIDKYCYMNPGDLEPTIPYVSTTTRIPRYDGTHSRVDIVPCYEIYFSWYPAFIHRFQLKDSFNTVIAQSHDEKDFICTVHPNDKLLQEEAELDEAVAQLKHLRISLSKSNPSPQAKYNYRSCHETYTSRLQTLQDNVTFGKQPDRELRLPIESEQQYGLNLESMLAQMHDLIRDYEFDLFYLNCSHVVRLTILAGLGNVFEERLAPYLSFMDTLPSIVDNPTRMLYTAERLQNACLQASLDKPVLAPLYALRRSQSTPCFSTPASQPKKQAIKRASP